MRKERRRRIIEGQGGRCLRCRSVEELTLDHIIPRSRGGSGAQSNLQVLCKPCNQMKGSMTIDYRKGRKGAERRGKALLEQHKATRKRDVVVYVSAEEGSGFVEAAEVLT